MSNTMQYKFYNDKTNKVELVSKPKWVWEAVYADGSVLKQFDDEGVYHQTNSIHLQRLAFFVVRNGDIKHKLVFDPETMKLIFFYVDRIQFGGQGKKLIFSIPVFGYEIKIKGRTTVNLTAILPDDTLMITNNRNIGKFL